MTPPPIHLSLPWPPAAEAYFRREPGGAPVSDRAIKYWRDVRWEARSLAPRILEGPVSVELSLEPPEEPAVGPADFVAPVLDALEFAKVIQRQSDIHFLLAIRYPPVEGGRVGVRVESMPALASPGRE